SLLPVARLEGRRGNGDSLSRHVVQDVYLIAERPAREDLEDLEGLLEARARGTLLHESLDLLESDPHAPALLSPPGTQGPGAASSRVASLSRPSLVPDSRGGRPPTGAGHPGRDRPREADRPTEMVLAMRGPRRFRERRAWAPARAWPGADSQ